MNSLAVGSKFKQCQKSCSALTRNFVKKDGVHARNALELSLPARHFKPERYQGFDSRVTNIGASAVPVLLQIGKLSIYLAGDKVLCA